MINPKLAEVTKALDDWCRSHNILYDIVCDESDLQGIMLFKKDTVLLSGLLDTLTSVVQEQGIHAQLRKVRGGNILAFSICAISESTMSRMISDAGEREVSLTFAERVEHALTVVPPKIELSQEPIDLYASAKKIAEGQYKFTTGATTKAFRREPNFGGKTEDAAGKKKKIRKTEFNSSLQEALNGIATPTGSQPEDLFSKFSRALKVLGDQLGIGPLQDRLKEQGIKWKKSDDAQSIILYIINGATNAPQPIARVSAEVLDNPSDFEEQLTHMLDFAQGDAPGAFKQKQDQIKNQERAVRDIAKAVSPQDQEGEVAKQMNAGLSNAGLAPEQQAAQTAAAPKPGMAPATAGAGTPAGQEPLEQMGQPKQPQRPRM